MKMMKFLIWTFIFATGTNQIVIPASTVISRDLKESILIEKYFISKNPSIAKNKIVLKEIRSLIASKRLLAKKYGLDLYLELARPQHESKYFEKPNALTKGKAGEKGWEQIMPSTGKHLGYSVEKLKVLKYNLECGAKFYHDLLVQYHGDHARALAYYNGGGNFMKIPQALWYSYRVITMRNDLVNYINKHI